MTKPDVFQGSVAVAETARDKASYSGFLAGLFETDVRWDLFTSIGIPRDESVRPGFPRTIQSSPLYPWILNELTVRGSCLSRS